MEETRETAASGPACSESAKEAGYVNISQIERAISLLVGSGLAWHGLKQWDSAVGAASLLAGGGLI